jgi:hypothetical protein
MGKANGGFVLTAWPAGYQKREWRHVWAPHVERNSQAAIVPAAALVAQLDRASDFESEGREFESLRARQKIHKNQYLRRVANRLSLLDFLSCQHCVHNLRPLPPPNPAWRRDVMTGKHGGYDNSSNLVSNLIGE